MTRDGFRRYRHAQQGWSMPMPVDLDDPPEVIALPEGGHVLHLIPDTRKAPTP